MCRFYSVIEVMKETDTFAVSSFFESVSSTFLKEKRVIRKIVPLSDNKLFFVCLMTTCFKWCNSYSFYHIERSQRSHNITFFIIHAYVVDNPETLGFQNQDSREQTLYNKYLKKYLNWHKLNCIFQDNKIFITQIQLQL